MLDWFHVKVGGYRIFILYIHSVLSTFLWTPRCYILTHLEILCSLSVKNQMNVHFQCELTYELNSNVFSVWTNVCIFFLLIVNLCLPVYRGKIPWKLDIFSFLVKLLFLKYKLLFKLWQLIYLANAFSQSDLQTHVNIRRQS